MPNYEQIEKKITDLGFSMKLLPSVEMKALPEILQEDETLEGIASGLYSSRNGVLVATGKRVIFFDKGRLWGSHVEEFPNGKITSVEYETGLIGGSITIFSAGNAAKIDMVPNIYCKPFADVVRKLIGRGQKGIPPQEEDFLTKLERLSTLKAEGMLTEEEFRLAKAKLLRA